ncbi:hypothetical protein DQ04_01591110 [Trypanosoma grayi]|uniref:hypothetical protein n=1 Tax=Trypanosoma grayi TaxID=71804 RepID=UPI0004F4976E|nr:hypothetical protein DQ04_01591110 [Trypanosoma grayi]KEG12602.1 hypothetical protein DQ04_01591110 [Trypanosoma grayi]
MRDHILSDPSSPPLKANAPLMVAASAVTPQECPLRRPRHSSVTPSHLAIVQSVDAVRKTDPRGNPTTSSGRCAVGMVTNSIDVIAAVCARVSWHSSKVTASNTRSIPSERPTTTRLRPI